MNKLKTNEERYAAAAVAIAKAIEHVSDTGDVELLNEIMDDSMGVMGKIAAKLSIENRIKFTDWLYKKADQKLDEIKKMP